VTAPTPLRIAWLGPIGDGGGPGLGRVLFDAFAELGDEIDLYLDGEYLRSQTSVTELLSRHPRVTAISQSNPWRWGRWYSRNRMSAFASGLLMRVWIHRQLGRRLVDTHQQRQYDCIFQFSQTELLTLGRNRDRLPPIVVHPCSHAAAELYWHRAESAYARKAESTPLHYAARAILWYRARRQRGELTKATLVVGPSDAFNRHLRRDYLLPDLPVAVLRHPVQRDRFQPSPEARSPERTVRLLFVSRMSTRKGVEMIVALSHRLADLPGQVSIELIGDKTLWSDYRAHLADLHPGVARYVGSLPGGGMPEQFRAADALLVPSHYEPGSLVVGEALASGLPVVVSDAVGPAEVLDPRCCRVFPAGDLDAFEAAVRALLPDLRTNWPELSELATAQSEQFEPATIAHHLREILARAAAEAT
jgi:glycosyltransferase involved in cell wall biosynthesis